MQDTDGAFLSFIITFSRVIFILFLVESSLFHTLQLF